MPKIVYLFDEMTGEFKGVFEAQESPLEPGKYITPEHSTDAVPPLCGESQYLIFQGGEWLINTLPQPEPTPAPTLEEIKMVAWAAIKAERDRRKVGGVKVKVGTVNKWFHSDDASRIQQMGLVMMGSGIPAGLQWKTMDGTFVTMDQTVAGNVLAAAAASDQAIFAVAEGHRVAMEASADPAAYDYSTGWPKIYGE